MKVLEKISLSNTIREVIRLVKKNYEIIDMDNSQDSVVVLYGPSHIFYISRTIMNEYIKELYFTDTAVDYITDNFRIAVAHKE